VVSAEATATSKIARLHLSFVHVNSRWTSSATVVLKLVFGSNAPRRTRAATFLSGRSSLFPSPLALPLLLFDQDIREYNTDSTVHFSLQVTKAAVPQLVGTELFQTLESVPDNAAEDQGSDNTAASQCAQGRNQSVAHSLNRGQ